MKLLKYYIDKITDNILYYEGILKKNRLFPVNQQNEKIPFFIVSAGRSGSTLLRKLLMQGGHVHIPPESDNLIPELIKKQISFSKEKDWPTYIDYTFNLISKSNAFKYWKINMTKIQNELRAAPPNKQHVYTIIDTLYLAHLIKHNSGAKLWGDKTPFLIFELKWLILAYPNCKIIHLLRDGRDVVSSSMNLQNRPLSYSLKRWRYSVQLMDQLKLQHRQLIEVKYEDFIQNPESALKSICKFLDIPYTPELFIDKKMHLGDDVLPHHQGIKSTINNESIGRWKRELSNSDKRNIQRYLKEELIKKGYKIEDI